MREDIRIVEGTLDQARPDFTTTIENHLHHRFHLFLELRHAFTYNSCVMWLNLCHAQYFYIRCSSNVPCYWALYFACLAYRLCYSQIFIYLFHQLKIGDTVESLNLEQKGKPPLMSQFMIKANFFIEYKRCLVLFLCKN